jgi:hypothetical protein
VREIVRYLAGGYLAGDISAESEILKVIHILINNSRKVAVSGCLVLIPHKVVVKEEGVALELMLLPITEIRSVFSRRTRPYELVSHVGSLFGRLIKIRIARVVGTGDGRKHKNKAVGVFNLEFSGLPEKIDVDENGKITGLF